MQAISIVVSWRLTRSFTTPKSKGICLAAIQACIDIHDDFDYMAVAREAFHDDCQSPWPTRRDSSVEKTAGEAGGGVGRASPCNFEKPAISHLTLTSHHYFYVMVVGCNFGCCYTLDYLYCFLSHVTMLSV